MMLPTYDQLMLPLLKLAAEDGQVHPIAALREQLAQRLNITSDRTSLDFLALLIFLQRFALEQATSFWCESRAEHGSHTKTVFQTIENRCK